jgi:arylsulfatase A-like enzyme
MTHRRVHPILAAFFLFALSVRTVFSASPDKPNILFIFMDDLNASIGGMGMHPDTRTPHMDRLRDRGVLFTNAGSNYPVCGPSRASIWSGLYPHTTGYLGHGRKWGSWRRNPVLRDSVTVFEHLRDQGGYHIYAAGKIHHNGDEDTSIFQNTDGSDGFAVKALFGPYITNGEERNAHGHPVVMTREEIQEGGCTNGDCDFGPFMQDPPIPGGTGSWVYEDGTPFRYVSETDRDLVPDEKSALQAVEWLKTHSGEKPFFMTIGILRPHSPLIVPPSYFERFPLEDIRIFPGRKLGDLADTGIGLIKPYQIETFVGGVNWGRTKYGSILRAGGETMLKRWTQAYLAAVSFVDDRVGEILDALDASPYADNTVVILSSDHGYHMGDKDMLHKFTPWESAVRVPLIFAGPGIASGKRSGVPVSLIDIFPTLNELACVPNDPNGTGNGVPLDGHSLVPLLKQPEKGEWDGPSSYLSVIQGAFTEKPGMKGDPARQHYTLRSATHRYIRWSNGYEELYNHSKDPWEWNNIADLADKEELIMLFRDQLTDMTGIHTESD